MTIESGCFWYAQKIALYQQALPIHHEECACCRVKIFVKPQRNNPIFFSQRPTAAINDDESDDDEDEVSEESSDNDGDGKDNDNGAEVCSGKSQVKNNRKADKPGEYLLDKYELVLVYDLEEKLGDEYEYDEEGRQDELRSQEERVLK